MDAQPDAQPIANAIEHVLTVCGFPTAQERLRVQQSAGFQVIHHLTLFENENVSKLASAMAKLPINQGRLYVNQIQVIKLQAACEWLRDQLHRGFELTDEFVVGNLTEDVLTTFIQERKADEDAGTADDVKAPEKFEPHHWIAWHMKISNYLKARRGSSNIPLYYVIQIPNHRRAGSNG